MNSRRRLSAIRIRRRSSSRNWQRAERLAQQATSCRQPYSGGLQPGEMWNVPLKCTSATNIGHRRLRSCCTDLDLSLFDGNVCLIVEDTAVSNQPNVRRVPTSSGAFTIQVPCTPAALRLATTPSRSMAATDVRLIISGSQHDHAHRRSERSLGRALARRSSIEAIRTGKVSSGRARCVQAPPRTLVPARGTCGAGDAHRSLLQGAVSFCHRHRHVFVRRACDRRPPFCLDNVRSACAVHELSVWRRLRFATRALFFRTRFRFTISPMNRMM